MSVMGAVTPEGGTVNAGGVNRLKHGMALKPSYITRQTDNCTTDCLASLTGFSSRSPGMDYGPKGEAQTKPT